MLYWIISIAWCIVGTAVFWYIMSSKWNKLDCFFVRTIDTFRTMHPNMPGHPGYLDLKSTIIRHAAATLVFSVILFFVDAKILVRILLFLNVLYACTPISRYKSRKKYLQDLRTAGHGDTASILLPLVRDSFIPVIHAIICAVVIFVLYGIRLSLK